MSFTTRPPASLLIGLATSLLLPVLSADDEREYDYGELNEMAHPGSRPELPLLDSPGLVDSYYDKKKEFAEETGFNYQIEYAAIAQRGGSGGDDFHADHELNLIAMWTMLDNPSAGQGTLMAWYQNAVTLGGVTTSEFMNSLGVLSPLNGGDTFPDNSANRLQLLSWEQRFNEHSRVMVGKLTTRVLMNLNRYAVSDREDFYSPMIVNNPVVPYTARAGLGLFGEHRQEDWYLSGMIRDASANQDTIDFDSVGDGSWEYAAEFGLTPEFEGLGQGNYRFTVYYTDEVRIDGTDFPSGWSFSASFDQDFGEKFGGFFRFSNAEDTFRAFEQRTTLGIQIKQPFCHPDDRLGLAFWSGEPANSGLGDEYGIETFWRLQVTRSLQVTPDLQLIVNPTFDPGTDIAVAGGLRARLEF